MILDNGFKYTKYYTTKAGVDCWRCTTKNCNARITTVADDTTQKRDILSHNNDHNHGKKVNNVTAVVARVACKRKATSDFAERPPSMWAAAPDISIRTTNGAESFHSHLNAQFYSAHPNIYVLSLIHI